MSQIEASYVSEAVEVREKHGAGSEPPDAVLREVEVQRACTGRLEAIRKAERGEQSDLSYLNIDYAIYDSKGQICQANLERERDLRLPDKPEPGEQIMKRPKRERSPEEKSREFLFGGKEPQDAIKADGVKQGSKGDCFFMATLAGLANSEKGRRAIQDMVKVNEDGSYTVTFPGAIGDPVHVTAESMKKAGVRKDQDGWAQVVETAFLKYREDIPLLGGLKKNGVSVAGALTVRGAMKLLTGKDVATDLFAGYSTGSGQLLSMGATSKENVRRDLEEALKDGRAVTVGADSNISKYLGLHDSGAAPGKHVYTVTGFDSKTEMVTVRNPWGHMRDSSLEKTGATADGMKHLGGGVLQMSLDTFYSRFSQMDISEKNSDLNAVRNTARSIRDTGGALIDAGSSLVCGDFGSAGESISVAKHHFEYTMYESLYAGSAHTWHTLTDHPEDILFSGLTPFGGPLALPVMRWQVEQLTNFARDPLGAAESGADTARDWAGKALEVSSPMIKGAAGRSKDAMAESSKIYDKGKDAVTGVIKKVPRVKSPFG